VRNKLTHLRSPASDEVVAYYLNRSLIQDVLHAAGAAEYTANKVYVAAAVENYVENELRVAWPARDLVGSVLAHPLVN
jgi:hypothetical protein